MRGTLAACPCPVAPCAARIGKLARLDIYALLVIHLMSATSAKQQAGKISISAAFVGRWRVAIRFAQVQRFPRQQAAHGCLGRNSVVLLRSSGSFSTCRIPCEFSRLWYALNIPALLICHRAFCPAKYRGDHCPLIPRLSCTLIAQRSNRQDFVFRKPFLISHIRTPLTNIAKTCLTIGAVSGSGIRWWRLFGSGI